MILRNTTNELITLPTGHLIAGHGFLDISETVYMNSQPFLGGLLRCGRLVEDVASLIAPPQPVSKELTRSSLAKMRKFDLIKLARTMDLPANGTADDVRLRIAETKFGRS